MIKLEAGKEYKTRDGNTARIYAVDCGGKFPIHGAVLALDGLTYHPVQWTVKGKILNDESQKRASDLMPPEPEKITVWVNIYPNNECAIYHKTRKDADSFATEKRIACVPLTYYKGEGLE